MSIKYASKQRKNKAGIFPVVTKKVDDFFLSSKSFQNFRKDI